MSELFKETDVASLSPKLEWARRHGIVTGISGTPQMIDGKEVARPVYAAIIVAHATTEDDALLLLAEKEGIKHYKVEQHERDQAASIPVWE